MPSAYYEVMNQSWFRFHTKMRSITSARSLNTDKKYPTTLHTRINKLLKWLRFILQPFSPAALHEILLHWQLKSQQIQEAIRTYTLVWWFHLILVFPWPPASSFEFAIIQLLTWTQTTTLFNLFFAKCYTSIMGTSSQVIDAEINTSLTEAFFFVND